ncbi:Leucine-rich repeat-containing G-protein coupled receptor 4 [Holothuria leucospilota]|uniref:Leucine-rich repeat-containing G-protein coupled receptor 4 n=1 Tax=Holothuria leucospilota TaxID=206669 RepID=A0A9Q1C113_HOLLE|nr:Leucine-rich repeat-containing G-protein coupled receptor 4 [Holothuria leucospilota]
MLYLKENILLCTIFLILCILSSWSSSIEEDFSWTCPSNTLNLCTCKSSVLLDCSNRKLSTVPWWQTLNFSNVNLSYNQISHLKSDSFIDIGLETIDLANNTLPSIPEDLFRFTHQLRALNISNNRLAVIPGNLFNSTPKLQTLDLSYNNLGSIPRDVFKSTPKLQTLDLSNNNLTRFQGYMLYSTPQLKTLDISYNNFSTVDDVADPSLVSTSIEKLSMSRNLISQLPTEFFFAMGQTTMLDLSRNSISSIKVGSTKITDETPKMEVLLLHRNNITVIPSRAFVALTNLRYICLFNNRIHTVENNAFNGRNLYIYLFGNNLTTIKGNPFGPHVHKIHLFGNELAEITLDDQAWRNLESTGAQIIVNCKYLDTLPAHKKTLTIACTRPSFHPSKNGTIPLEYVSNGSFPLADTLQMEGFKCNKNECQPCPTGTFGNTMNECLPCPSGGFYQDEIGKSGKNPNEMACKQCRNGTYVKERGKGVSPEKCEVCPDGTNRNIPAGYRACRCKTNYTRINRYGPCSPCVDPGVDCSQDFQALKPGYFWSWDFPNARISDYQKFVQNLKREEMNLVNNYTTYTGEIPRVFKCPRKDSCINNDNVTIKVACARGYKGWLCGKCDKGFYPALNTCLPCPKVAALLAVFLGFLLVCILLCMLLSWQIERGVKHKKQRRSVIDVIISRIKILLGFYQIVGKLFESLHTVTWVGPFELVGAFISYMELNLVRELVSPRCLFKTTVLDPEHKFIIGMTIPILIMLIPFLYYKAREGFIKYKYPDSEIKSKVKKIKSRLLTYITVVLFFIYPNISTIIFSMYPTSCAEFHLSKNATAENATIWRLRSDYDIDCQGSNLAFYYISAYFFTVVYVIAFPAILLYLLWKYYTPWSMMQCADENNTSLVEDQKAVSTKEEIPLVVTHEDVPPEIPVWLKFLCENYREQFWFWEIIELTRKSTQTLFITMYGWDNDKTVFLTICISVLFLTLHARYLPMKCPYDQRLQVLFSLIAIFINVVLASMKRSKEFKSARNLLFFLILNTAVLLIIAGEVLFRMLRNIIKIIPEKARVAVIAMWHYLFSCKTSKRERIV